MITTLSEALQGNPYQGYAYSYPHKTAYRAFPSPIPLQQLWSAENREALFLYVHIPFCEMRCGFCNLFTMSNPKEDLVIAYLHALARQAGMVKASLGEAVFARLAVGGGTPSFLEETELDKLFDILEKEMLVQPEAVPFSFEVSPKTVTPSKLHYLRERGVDRISIGVQSFLEEESKALGRPQRNAEVHQALEWIRRTNFRTFNIDLIYGGATQTPQSWLLTLEKTLAYQPEEIYLYPLYVRPLTGLEKLGTDWDNFRLHLYRLGRDYLLSNGYEQVSMRMFRKKGLATAEDIAYCCQEDGMVGLGAGARSYTTALHYATEYAVGRKGIKGIIGDFVERNPESYRYAEYGIQLNEAEQQRRYLIKSLLHSQGLSLNRFRQRFGFNPLDQYSQLHELIRPGLARLDAEERLSLTPAGLERSDTIGPWLYSESILALMHQYELQ